MQTEHDEEVIQAVPKKGDEIDVKFSKRGLIISLIILVVLLAGGIVWQTKAYVAVYKMIMPASMDIVVTDKDSSTPIANAVIKVDGKSYTTNTDGKVAISGLQVGDYSFEITAEGYLPASQSLKLNRKANTLAQALTLNIVRVEYSGTVKNYISELAISDANVTAGTDVATSDKDGAFLIKSIVVGEKDVVVEKAGFIKKTEKVVIAAAKTSDFALTPEGQVFFASNRDEGKAGIYSCNYDGTDVKQIVKRVADTEDDSMTVSPDKTKIAFLSTRDKRKFSDSQSFTPQLYMINSNGDNLVKISADYNIYNVRWSSNSKYLLWNSQPAEKESNSNTNLYTLKTAKTEKLNQNGSSQSFTLNSDGTAIVWAQSLITGDPASEQGLYYKVIGGDTKKIFDKGNASFYFSNDGKKVNINYYDDAAQKSKNVSYTIATSAIADYVAETNKNDYKLLSPDKKTYAYTSSRDGKTDLYTSDLDGKNEKKLTTMGTVTGGFEWELNNEYILFSSSKTAETARYVVSVLGGTAKKVTDIYMSNANYGY